MPLMVLSSKCLKIRLNYCKLKQKYLAWTLFCLERARQTTVNPHAFVIMWVC